MVSPAAAPSGKTERTEGARSGSGPMLVLSMASVMTLRLTRNSMHPTSGAGQAGALPPTGSAANRLPSGNGL